MKRLDLFATPVHRLRAAVDDETLRAAAELLVADRESHPGLEYSNVGGWHSPPTVAKRQEPPLKAVMRALVDGVDQVATELRGSPLPNHGYKVVAWAMVMEDGDYTIPHDHAGTHFSCVLYLDIGQADLEAHPCSGYIVFTDPRRGIQSVPGIPRTSTSCSVTPVNGLLVVFPGWLQHYVHPYRGPGTRVCISANLELVLKP